MPKPMYVWSGSAWVSVASEVESLAGFATQSYADNTPATRMIVPTSIVVGSGSGSVSTSGAATFSGASSVSLNNVFSSTYDTYKIVVSGITGSSAPYDLRLRFRDGTGDISSANYQSKQIFGRDSSTTAAENGGNNSSQTSSTLVFGGAVFNGDINIFRPNLATITSYVFSGDYAVGGYLFGSGTFGLTNQFTGFSLIPSTGNISGTIRVYGMKN